MTTTTPSSGLPLSRLIFAALLLFAVGVAGVFVGTWVQTVRSAGPQAFEPVHPPPMSLLAVGDSFPAIVLTPREGGERSTVELLGDSGGVALFLDLECPPCVDMAVKWTQFLQSNAVPGLTVFGVTNQDDDAISDFMINHNVKFPILQDDGHVFRNVYEVTRFPLEAIVDAERRIRSVSFDSERPIDAGAVSTLLGR